MNKKLSNNIAELNESVKQYLHAKIDLAKLLLLKKASKSLNFLFVLFLIILLSVIILAFAGGAFIMWYGITFNSYLEGTLIVTGFLLFVLFLVILFRKKILTPIFLSNISNILFEEDEDED